MNLKTEITKTHYNKTPNGLFFNILKFFSLFYGMGSRFKNFLYDNQILKPQKVDAFVIGNPLNLDGSASKRTEETLELKKIIEDRYKKEVFMQDERLSTVEAERMLISNDTKRKNRKKVIDKIAATIILQGFLDRSKRSER